MKSPFQASLAVVLIVLTAPGQEREREVASFDGQAHEHVTVEGRATWLHDAGRISGGVGALRVRPSPDKRYYGVTIRKLPAEHPRAARLSVFNEGTGPEKWFVRMQRIEPDPKRRKALRWAASVHTLSPGWSTLEIDLAKVLDETGAHRIDMTRGIGVLRISRRKRNDDDAGLRVDRLRFVDEDGAGRLRQRLLVALQAEDQVERRNGVKASLPLLPDLERVTTALKLLGSADVLPSIRRAAREAISTASQESAVAAVLAALERARGSMRLELLWALASMPSPTARNQALRLAASAGTPTPERAALLQAIGRRGATDVAPIAKRISARRPWPERAALIKALRECATPDAVEALIEILRQPGSVRAADDATATLTRLTGKDLGASASAWEGWWKANKASTLLNDTGARPRLPYATYYGIPVPNGRTAFVIDLSGSMKEPVKGGRAEEHLKRARHLRGLEIKSRLDLAKAELVHALENLAKEAWVTVIAYGDSAEPIVTTKGLEPASKALKKKLARRVFALSSSGKTNIHDGLLRAFHPRRKPSRADVKEGPDTVFLLTDGNPSTGPLTSRVELRDTVLQWNLGRMIRINSINVGAARSRWLQQLASGTDGQFLDLTSEPTRGGRGRGNRRTP